MAASSGAPPESQGLSPELLAALELGFENLLIELDPAAYSTQKRDESAPPVGRALRASDLAFPTHNNAFYYPPESMNFMHAKLNDQAPARYALEGAGLPDPGDDPAACRRRMVDGGALFHLAGTAVMALMAFGTAGVYSLVTCDMRTRFWLRAHPLFRAQLHTAPDAAAFAFRLAPFPGRGLGFVAARAIKKGETVVREPPLLVLMRNVDPGLLRAFSDELTRAGEQAMGHMHPRALAALDALHDCHADHPLRHVCSPRVWKVKTNAFAVYIPTTPPRDGPQHSATFEIMSRFNHSCAANLDFNWSCMDFQGSMRAKRDIAPGEELTMSYLTRTTMDAPRETRRAELLRKYRFECDCTRCGPL